MNPFAILMFIFSGALFLYAGLLYATQDARLIARSYTVKMKDSRAYARRFAKIIALVAVAPAHAGLAALFSDALGAVVLFVEMALAIWIGTMIQE